MKGTIFLLCLFLAQGAYAAGIVDNGGVRAVVNSGHRGPVLALEYDQNRSVLFSAGTDGTVRVWDPAGRSLLKSLIVTNLRTAMLAADPSRARVAVLITDGIHAFSLEVWDWQQGKRMFQIPLTDAPLFIRYSASGRYLFFSLPGWRSLQMVDADKGSPVSMDREGNGIVGLAVLSRTEKALMTYRLTGTLSFWDLASGKLLEEHDTEPQLSHLRVSHDLTFMVGSTATDIEAIDLATGAVRARASVPGVASLDISPSDDEVACAAADGTVTRWNMATGTLTRATDPLQAPPAVSVVRFGPESLYAGARDGAISSFGPGEETATFPVDARAVITGSDARGDMVAFATADWIRIFTSGLTGAVTTESGGSDTVRTFQVDNPFKAPVGVEFLSDRSLLVYRNADGPGDFRLFNISTGSFGPAPAPLPGPIMSARADEGSCLLLSRDGTLRVIDTSTGATKIEMTRPGAIDAALAGNHSIVEAGDAGIAAQGSLVKINLDTGETDPIPTMNQYTYEVLSDGQSGTLYSLGVDGDGTTNLVSHAGTDFQKETRIDSSSGEHLFASLVLDPASKSLYSTLGREQIFAWKDGGTRRLDTTARGAVGLMKGSRLLYVVNRDSSIALANPDGGGQLAELSLFGNGGWALTMHDGKFAASPGAEQLVNVLDNDKPVQNRTSFLIPVQIAEGR